jgi:hypothetical protein
VSNFLTRRDLGRLASFFLLGGLVPARRSVAAEASAEGVAVALEPPPNVYEALGVRPLINCRGTITVIGGITGDTVTLTSNVTERHGDALRYRFTGTIAGGTMSGTLDIGEYLNASWVARRYVAGQRA